MELGKIGSPICEQYVLDRYGCKTREELNSKMESLWLKRKKVKFPWRLETVEFSGSTDVTLQHIIHAMDVVQADENWEVDLKKTVADLRRTGGCKKKLSFQYTTDSYEYLTQRWYYMAGVDVPGAKDAPLGLGYYDELWMAIYLGNYQDFMEIVDGMNTKALSRALNKRQGYFKVTPIFVPFMGMHLDVLLSVMRQNDPKELKYFELMYPRRDGQYLKIFNELIQLGAKVDVRDRNGRTALFYLFLILHRDGAEAVSMANKLLEGGVDPNMEDNFGNNVLHCAIDEDRFDLMDVLIAYGANPYVKSRNIEFLNETMIETAVRLKKVDHIQVMVKAQRKKIAEPTDCCSNCYNPFEMTEMKPATRTCSRCKIARYCSMDCQKEDWKLLHKSICKVYSLGLVYHRIKSRANEREEEDF